MKVTRIDYSLVGRDPFYMLGLVLANHLRLDVLLSALISVECQRRDDEKLSNLEVRKDNNECSLFATYESGDISRTIIISLKEEEFVEGRKLKAMISQPMAGRTEEEIVATREAVKNHCEEQGFEFVNTLFTDEWYEPDNMKKRGVVNIPLCFLAKSLENMSKCDIAIFAKGWQSARGCNVEHMAAQAYGMTIFYANEDGTF